MTSIISSELAMNTYQDRATSKGICEKYLHKIWDISENACPILYRLLIIISDFIIHHQANIEVEKKKERINHPKKGQGH